MNIVITYYLIGFIVTAYFIRYYRFSSTKTAMKERDAIGGLIGPWLWPIQIIIHIRDKFF